MEGGLVCDVALASGELLLAGMFKPSHHPHVPHDTPAPAVDHVVEIPLTLRFFRKFILLSPIHLFTGAVFVAGRDRSLRIASYLGGRKGVVDCLLSSAQVR